MRVFFDDQIFAEQEQGGISRYFAELARALGRAGVETRVFGGITRNVYLGSLRDSPGVMTRFWPRRDRLRINTWVARLSRIGRRLDFARARRAADDWMYHATNYKVDPWIARRATVTVLTVFDMIAEKFCDAESRERSLELKRGGVALAHGILSISQQTARDFAEWFPEQRDTVRVTPLAASLPRPSAKAREAARAMAPYVLFVGKRGGYKNGRAVLEAFGRVVEGESGGGGLTPALRTEGESLRLVCFGGEPLGAEEVAVLERFGARERTVCLQGDDDVLAGYYEHALALLYPSRYEGFGLPVLEAMQLGCPVITTRCGSLPEVGGEAALYVAPDDTAGMAALILQLKADDAFRARCTAAGRAQAALFSWEQTAARTKAAYDELLAGGSRRNVITRT